MIIDERCSLPDHEREFYSRYVIFRPGEGQVVEVNPPRFSWRYLPEVVPELTPWRGRGTLPPHPTVPVP